MVWTRLIRQQVLPGQTRISVSVNTFCTTDGVEIEMAALLRSVSRSPPSAVKIAMPVTEVTAVSVVAEVSCCVEPDRVVPSSASERSVDTSCATGMFAV